MNNKLIFIILLIFFSCRQDREPDKATPASFVRLPGDFEIYNSELGKKSFIPGNTGYSLKLFTTINVSCATCLLNLEKWKLFYKEATKCNKILLVPVCYTKDNFEILKFLFEEKKISGIEFPLLLDSVGTFTEMNKQFGGETSGMSVITNAANKILFSGNPMDSETVRKRFLEFICNFSAQDLLNEN